MTFVSEFLFSDCQVFTKPERQRIEWTENRSKDPCAPENRFLSLMDVSARGEVLFFSEVAKEQLKVNECAIEQAAQLKHILETDKATGKYVFENTRIQLAKLQMLQYQKKRLELDYQKLKMSCDLAQALPFLNEKDLDLVRSSEVKMNSACPAKKMTPAAAQTALLQALSREEIFTSNLLQISDQISTLESSIPMFGSSQMQKVAKTLSAKASEKARFDHANEKNNDLFIRDNADKAVEVFNEGFNNVSAEIPNVTVLHNMYSNHHTNLKDANKQLADAKKQLTTPASSLRESPVFALTENQKMDLFAGPTAQQFFLDSLANVPEGARAEVLNNLCRLDARYGKRREATEQTVNTTVGIATLFWSGWLKLPSGMEKVSAWISKLPTPPVPAKPGPKSIAFEQSLANATMKMSKLSDKLDVRLTKMDPLGKKAREKRLGFAKSSYADVPLAALGIQTARSSCRHPFTQAKECVSYSKEVLIKEFAYADCIADASVALSGGVSIGTQLLRQTKPGRKLLEVAVERDFAKTRDEVLAAFQRKTGSAAAKVTDPKEIAVTTIESMKETASALRKGMDTEEKAKAINDFYRTGSVRRMMDLKDSDLEDIVVALRQFNQTDMGVVAAKLKASSDAGEKARLSLQLQQTMASRKTIDQLYDDYTKVKFASKMTEPAEKAMKAIEDYELRLKLGAAVLRTREDSLK